MREFGGNPKIQIDVDVKSKPKIHGDNIYEVELLIKAETTVEMNHIYNRSNILRVFTVENAEGELLDKILMIECPKFCSLLRSVLASCTRGGFPPNDCPSRFCYNV